MFTTISPLPLSVTFQLGETASSLASRLARRNGAPRMLAFLTDCSIDQAELTNGLTEACARLATFAGIAASDLLAGTPQLVAPGWFQLGAERIKFTAFDRTRMRTCPACQTEAGNLAHVAHPGTWQLTSIRTCALHGCLLVPMPTLPGNKDTFDTVQLAKALPVVEPLFPDPANHALEAYILNRIANGAGESWLDRLPLHVAAQTCEAFGVLLNHGADANRDDLDDAAWLATGAAGFAVLSQGPDAVRARLKSIQDAHPIDNTLYRTRYRVFFEWLRYRDDDPAFDPIRDLVRDFIFRNFPIAEGAIVLGQPCPEQYVHSLSTARARYGLSGWKLGRRLTALGLAERSTTGKGFQLKSYIPTDVIAGITSDFAGLLNATEAGQRLGIERFMIAKLTRPGLVEKYFDEHNASPMYHPAALDGFLERLRGLVTDGVTDDLLDIPTAAHRLRIPTERVVEIILRNQIGLSATDKRKAKFPDFQVSLSALRDAMNADHSGAIRPTRAAETLGVNIRTVRALLDSGHLDGRLITDTQTSRKRRYVDKSSSEAFASNHVTVTALAEQSGRLPGVEAVLQLDRGMKPIPLGLRSNMIFRRADIQ